ncbi:HNH endonuclease [Bacillus sp. V5-8f]|uniref:HNH endonuclease n=1 Tax=Bacillus sp. V5-8f TaxID=2053044 RepID=UPI000C78CDC5|nr:HNH endonuclease [Bacillus sp. V5-8f]PLT31971.1 hypothetical protein CUU64_20505 [Bacillus sp. V5-8f]
MGLFRSLSKGIGTVGGGLVGGAVKLTGKAVGTKYKDAGEWLEEVGENVHGASKIAMDNFGQLAEGIAETTYGAIKKDEYYKQKGIENVKDSAGRTVKGIGSAVKYTAVNAGTTYKGITSGNKEETIKGLKNIGKVVAVTTLAVGVVDIIDGADVADAEQLDTMNSGLNGYEHPDTGVPFVEKTVELPNGQVVEGTFPVFESDFSVILTGELYLESDHVHFDVANETLYQAIQENPNLAQELGLSNADVQALENGQTPDGYTWHHNEEPGLLQLVNEETHEHTAHSGGRSIWGGGSEYR